MTEPSPGRPGLDLRLEDLGSWAALETRERQAALAAAGVGDGLPLGDVSAELVRDVLEGMRLAPDHLVAALPPLMQPVTADAVAIWSLIAGCQPVDVPIVLAAVEALSAPEFNGLGVLTTTGAAAVAVVVNGPAAARFNAGANLLGPGAGANGAVGRAVAFVTRAAGAVPGVTDMATMGQPGKYTMCFAENEQASPWEPLHVSRGLARASSAVTIFAASGTIEVTDMHAATADDVLATLSASMYQLGSLDPETGVLGGGAWLVLTSPEWATMLAREGMSRDDCCAALAGRAAWPSSTLSLMRYRSAGGQPAATLRAVTSPDDITLVVAGGVGVKQTLMPAWSGGSRSVTTEMSVAI